MGKFKCTASISDINWNVEASFDTSAGYIESGHALSDLAGEVRDAVRDRDLFDKLYHGPLKWDIHCTKI